MIHALLLAAALLGPKLEVLQDDLSHAARPFSKQGLYECDLDLRTEGVRHRDLQAYPQGRPAERQYVFADALVRLGYYPEGERGVIVVYPYRRAADRRQWIRWMLDQAALKLDLASLRPVTEIKGHPNGTLTIDGTSRLMLEFGE